MYPLTEIDSTFNLPRPGLPNRWPAAFIADPMIGTYYPA
jgi:hypothetical protein